MASFEAVSEAGDFTPNASARMHPLAEPLVLRIPGEFWDTQLYSGRLYLFGVDATITVLDWDRLISEWPLAKGLHLALECAFMASDYLYGTRWARFFSDEEIRQVVEAKFRRLHGRALEPSKAALERATIKVQENPFPFPHADATIYSNQFYVGSRDGLYQSDVNKRRVYPVKRAADRHWDGTVLNIAASYQTLALAGGTEGLFQHRITQFGRTGADPERVSPLHSDRCAWTYWSIYSSSRRSGGYLAEFERATDVGARDIGYFPMFEEEPVERSFVGTLDSQEIFGRTGFSWAGKDKIYTIDSNELLAVQYNPFSNGDRRSRHMVGSERPDLQNLGGVPVDTTDGHMLAAEVAQFGTVLEDLDGVQVILSTEDRFQLPGEPARWRVFPRSKQYQNQLHAIYEGYLDVFSFNHDYFVDQRSKRFGMKASLR